MTINLKRSANKHLKLNASVGNLRADENTFNKAKGKVDDDFGHSVMGSSKDIDGFIRLKDVLQLIPVCKSSWWRGVKEGRYPQQVKIGHRAVAWRRSSIVALVRQINNGEMKL